MHNLSVAVVWAEAEGACDHRIEPCEVKFACNSRCKKGLLECPRYVSAPSRRLRLTILKTIIIIIINIDSEGL